MEITVVIRCNCIQTLIRFRPSFRLPPCREDLKLRRPPPSTTLMSSFSSTSCDAISLQFEPDPPGTDASQPLPGVCAYDPAGVACVTRVVVTTPPHLPSTRAKVFVCKRVNHDVRNKVNKCNY